MPDDLLPIMDLPAEMICLNALAICDDGLYADVRSQLSAEMFLSRDNQIIFALIAELRDAGTMTDGAILYGELDRRGTLEDIGGGEYLAQVLHSAPDARNARHYVKAVVESHRLRQIDALAGKAIKAVRMPNDGTRSGKIIEHLQTELAKLTTSTASNRIQTLGECVAEAIEAMKPGKAPNFISTGVDALDRAIGGLGIGEMTLIAARPSMGKSLFGKQIADNIASRKIPVFFGNVEESNLKTARNWMSRRAKINNQDLRQGKLTEAQRKALPEWENFARDLPYHLCDKAMSTSAMCASISLAHARHGIRVAFVDYLQLLEGTGRDNRQEEVANISRSLKNLFKKLNIAGVVMAQLNRGNEAGQVRPPRLSDLRESGQLEQDADAVLMIHRPDFYIRETGGNPTGRVQIIIAKYRDGSREGDIELVANLNHQEFIEQTDPFASAK